MGVLLLQFRKQNLNQEINNLEYQITDLNQQLSDYQSMASAISNDSPTISDIASMPASLFNAGLGTLNNMHAQATQYANTVMSNMQAGSVFSNFGSSAPAVQQIAYLKAYEQGQQQYKKQVQAQLNQKEKEITTKKTSVETSLKMKETELQNLDQQLSKDITRSVANYGSGNGG